MGYKNYNSEYKVKNYKSVNLRKTKDLEKFIEFCNKNNLKYASILQNLIREFNKNPEKFLISD